MLLDINGPKVKGSEKNEYCVLVMILHQMTSVPQGVENQWPGGCQLQSGATFLACVFSDYLYVRVFSAAWIVSS